jgi:sn-glycerol 3-phosphate transport system ATP-binding protein
MGRALVRQPAAFLFDEPLSNLDAKLRVQMRLEIKAMQRKVETTSLYVTHDQVEAMTLADRLVVMNAGHAEQIDTPLNVYREPATTFVAGFIGSPAMNLMAAAVAANGKGLVLDGSGTVKPRDIVLPESGRKVLIGIRPEHLSPVADLNADLHLAVQAVETLGADTLAHGRLADGGAGSEMVARLPGTSAVKAGEVLPLAIEPGMTHLFDRESGRRIV